MPEDITTKVELKHQFNSHHEYVQMCKMCFDFRINAKSNDSLLLFIFFSNFMSYVSVAHPFVLLNHTYQCTFVSLKNL